MTMTLNAMATEVAKAIGGQTTTSTIDLAKTSIKASVMDWNSAKDWNYLLKDTSLGFSITGVTCTKDSAVVNAVTTDGGFDGINPGVTVTVTSASPPLTLPVNTTVLSLVRSDGTTLTPGQVTQITLSNPFTGTPATATQTLTFSADIPIKIGVNEYSLPTDFNTPYGARVLTNPRQLEYIHYREWNKKVIVQNINGSIEAYTIYNPVSPQSQNFRTYRMRVFRTPAVNDTIHLQYFRNMDPEATSVDVPTNYQYLLIDYAIWRLIRLKNTEDTRLSHLYEVAQKALSMAMVDDEELSENHELRLMSQMESWNGERNLWTNSQFYPTALEW